MKINKVILVVLGVVIIGVAAGFLYMSYSKQVDEQTQLKAKITGNQQKLAALVAERENWQSQLVKVQAQLEEKKALVASATSSLEAAKAEWPREAQSIEYDEILFGLADGWKLSVTVVSAGEGQPRRSSGVVFDTTTFNVSVTGSPLTAGFADQAEFRAYTYRVVGDILSFIDAMALDKNFGAASIDLVDLSVPAIPGQEELVAAGVEVDQPVGTVAVTLYTYKGG